MADRPELGAQRHNVPPKRRQSENGGPDDMEIHAKLMSCAEAMHTVQEAEEFLINSGVVTKTRMALLSLENMLLDIAASEKVTAGVHYHICLSDGISSKVARYFEAGCLQGMMNQEFGRDFIPYKIFTVADIQQRNIQLKERLSRTHQKRTAGRENVKPPRWRPAKRYYDLLEQIKRKWEDLMAIVKTCNVVFHSAILSIMKYNPKGSSPDDHYLQVTGHEPATVNKLLVDHRVTGDQEHDEIDVLSEEFAPQSLNEQMKFLSSLANLHSDSSGTNTSLQRHLSISVERNRVPVSVRNKIIFFCVAGDITRLLPEIASLKGETLQRTVSKRPRVYRRNFKGRVAQETANDLCSDSAAMPTTSMAWPEEDRLFDLFVHQVLNNGKVCWREHSEERDSFVFNSYDTTSGHIMPVSFEHLAVTPNKEISCSCETFVLLKHRPTTSSSDSLTCMHERIVTTYLLPFYDGIVKNSCPSKKACQIFQEAYIKCNSPIEQITPATNPVSGTLKFSVLGTDKTLRFVHLSFNGTYIACQSGQCSLKMGLSGRVKSRQIRSLASAKLCAHLQVMLDHFEQWSHLISEEGEEAVSDNPEPEEVDDQPGTVLEDGLWHFPAYSCHRPSDPESETLKRNIAERLKMFSGEKPRDRNGVLLDVELWQHTPPAICDCNAGFETIDKPDGINLVPQFGNGTTNLFTRHGAAECRVFAWKCKASRCTVTYSGEGDSIFFKTASTAICDEVLLDFENRLFTNSTGTNFSSFVQEMNFIYRSNGCADASFMSKATFIELFFSWIACKKIDFRKYIDPYCLHNPDMLACDGTHIGPTIRNISMSPIEQPEGTEITVNVETKRFGRTFIPGSSPEDKDARKCLEALAHLCVVEGNTIEVDQLQPEQIDNLIQLCPVSFQPLIKGLYNKTLPHKFRVGASGLIHLLSSQAALIAIIPFSQSDRLQNCVTEIQTGNYSALATIRDHVGLEIYDFLKAGMEANCVSLVVDIVLALVHEVKTFYNSTLDIASEEIPGSYNPASGIAYYFSPTGQKVRRLPQFNTDDHNLKSECSKRYPRVSRNGYGNSFFWFCPKHGHCYGFHLIPGSEGRKDPFNSMLKYKVSPPEHVFYDFACQLSEYSLTRAPEYFKHVRFWHDIFHSYNHKCGDTFKSCRVPSLQPNTEICEQFNSYLQRLKFMSTHLSQEKFCFLIQYAIYKWNIRRTEICERKMKTIIKCSQ